VIPEVFLCSYKDIKVIRDACLEGCEDFRMVSEVWKLILEGSSGGCEDVKVNCKVLKVKPGSFGGMD
jgi:hypothetical protein